jgi:hypothetical protein
VKRLFLLLSLILTLAACAPVAEQAQDFVAASANAQLCDGATLRLEPGRGVVFDPGEADALGLELSLSGQDVRCPACTFEDGLAYAVLGDVRRDERLVLEASGRGVSALAHFRRPGESRLRVCVGERRG